MISPSAGSKWKFQIAKHWLQNLRQGSERAAGCAAEELKGNDDHSALTPALCQSP
jgi:hypothetical protein